jgi:capsular exopolysaccharide synthesis family protein
MLSAEVESLRKRLQEVAVNGARLDGLQQNWGDLEELTKKITAEEQALSIEMDAPTNVKVLEEPFVSQGKSKMRRSLVTGVAGLGALALVLFALGWWEHRARRVAGLEEVVQGLGIELIGTLPPVARRGRGCALGTEGEGFLVESADSARTMLLSAARAHAFRIVMVTSATTGEGKTSVVCQLGLSLARAGFKTLVLDGDMRRPCLHTRLNLPNGAGFSEVLCQSAEPATVIAPTSVPGLALLPAGRLDGRALQVLAQGVAAPVFQRLLEEYDFLIVDSPPVLPVADALLIGQYVDAVVFSILRKVSRVPSVFTAYRRLAKLGVRVLGAVVNGVAEDDYGCSYSYGYARQAAPKA